MNWLQRNSLWLIGFGLMLASSGIDGAYMARWMATPWAWSGYALNTISDVAGEVLMYQFGRLQQEPKNTKKHRLSWWILLAEVIAIIYSWFFSWRQLRIILPAIEGDAAEWVALTSAAFVPILLAAIGYTQALLAGRFTNVTDAALTRQTNVTDAKATSINVTDAALTPTIADYRCFAASGNGNNATMTRQAALQWASDAGMDVTGASGKGNRDKVARWWRTTTQETQQ